MYAIIVRTVEGEGVLQVLEENLQDLSGAFTELGELALQDARAEIAAHGNGSWAEMHELTPLIARLIGHRERLPETLLHDTGGLVASLTPLASDNIFEVGPMEASFGSQYASSRTNFGIAKYQQQGTRKSFLVLQGEGFGLGGIPARGFLSWCGERIDEYDAIVLKHAVEGTE